MHREASHGPGGAPQGGVSTWGLWQRRWGDGYSPADGSLTLVRVQVRNEIWSEPFTAEKSTNRRTNFNGGLYPHYFQDQILLAAVTLYWIYCAFRLEVLWFPVWCRHSGYTLSLAAKMLTIFEGAEPMGNETSRWGICWCIGYAPPPIRQRLSLRWSAVVFAGDHRRLWGEEGKWAVDGDMRITMFSICWFSISNVLDAWSWRGRTNGEHSLIWQRKKLKINLNKHSAHVRPCPSRLLSSVCLPAPPLPLHLLRNISSSSRSCCSDSRSTPAITASTQSR